MRQADEHKAQEEGSRAQRGTLGCRSHSHSSGTPATAQRPWGKEGESLLRQPVIPLRPAAAIWAVNLQVSAPLVTCKERELVLWLRQLSVAFQF